MEPSSYEVRRDRTIWKEFRKGSVAIFIRRCRGHDMALACCIAKGWEDKAKIGSIMIDFSIELATKMLLEGRLYSHDEKISEEERDEFFEEGEEPVRLNSGYKREHLPEPWDRMAWCVIKYFTLEGRFLMIYYPHVVLLKQGCG